MSALASRYAGAVDLGGGPLPTSGADTFIAVLEPSGALRWSKTLQVGAYYGGGLLPTDPPENGFGIAATSCALVLSTTSTTVDLGSGPWVHPVTVMSLGGPYSILPVGVAALAL